MHPVCIDACLQAGVPALWRGFRTSINCSLVPAVIDELTIHAYEESPKIGIAVSYADYTGHGNRDVTKSYQNHITVYNEKTKYALLELSGLRFNTLDTANRSIKGLDFAQLQWMPDISSLMSDPCLLRTQNSIDSSTLPEHHDAIDLVVHQRPNLAVLEVVLTSTHRSI